MCPSEGMCRNVGDRPTANPVVMLLHSELKTLALGHRLASILAGGRRSKERIYAQTEISVSCLILLACLRVPDRGLICDFGVSSLLMRLCLASSCLHFGGLHPAQKTAIPK